MTALDQQLAPHLSRERCTDLLIELVRVPSPQTELLEAEPQLRRFIEAAIEPRLRALDPEECRYDAMGNLIARFGTRTRSRSLMLIGHAMNQPPATMPDPYSGSVVDGAPFGISGDVVRGRGASEQKSTLAAMLHGLEAVRRAGIPIEGSLEFVCCVSGETGKTDAIRNVVEVEKIRADIAFVYGNALKLQLGNRGRVDMLVTVTGQPCHSSRPEQGCNAITGAVEVISRLTREIDGRRAHPDLGPASLTINRVRSFPDSTHTLQGRCEISVDRRLLPGDDPDVAAAEITRVAMAVDGMPDPVSGKPLHIAVTRGPAMHPSLITPESPVARVLARAFRIMLGRDLETLYGKSAFDQGYLNHAGIPTANFGPGEEGFAHTDNDIASVERTFDAARVYAFLIADHLGPAKTAQAGS